MSLPLKIKVQDFAASALLGLGVAFAFFLSAAVLLGPMFHMAYLSVTISKWFLPAILLGAFWPIAVVGYFEKWWDDTPGKRGRS